MSNQRVVVREIEWQEMFPWLVLVKSASLALTGRILLLAFLGWICVTAGHKFVGSVFFKNTADTSVQQWKTEDGRFPWTSPDIQSPAEFSNPKRITPRITATANDPSWVSSNWMQMTKPITRLFERSLGWTAFFYTGLCGLWTIIIWAFFGGALTRTAAMYLTRDEMLGITSASKESSTHYLSYLAAPMLPLAGMFALGLPLAVIGLCSKIGFFAWLTSVFWFLFLIGGFLLAILAIGLYVGAPLMWATISVEQTDAFDALSRCYAYVFQRPLKLLWYIIVASVLGFAGMFAVESIAKLAIHMTTWGISWGAGVETTQTLLKDGATQFWQNLARAFAGSFSIGMLWTGSVGIYLLLRRDIDGVEMDEVAFETSESDLKLPPLKEHESGVPSVVETPAESSATEEGVKENNTSEDSSSDENNSEES